MNATTPPLLEVRNLCKRFPGVIALDSVAFQAHAHEVHALIGENGAGKSTLMKILAGVLPADAGEILLDGRPAALRTPLHSLRLGIHQLPQDIGVIANLSAAENIHVGAEPHWGPWLNRGRELQTSAAALEAAGARFDPRTPMWQLNTAQQQRVVIARAIARAGRVLVLDEPTSCLGERDAEQLLHLVCRLRGQGMAIIYISHRLNEIYALADRITVLHEGRVMGTLAGEAISTQTVIRLMSRGGGITEPPHRKAASTPATAGAPQAAARPLLQASGITDGQRIKPASFDIARGEVLGLTGLVGSGRSRLCRLLCAADALRGGSLRIDGHDVAFRSPAQALRAGVVYVPDTDHAGALFPRMSLHDNVTLGLVGQHRKLGLICDDAELERRSRDVIDRLQIRRADEGSGAALSGGMRRKLALARGLVMQPRLLILDEPLKGLDPAAAADVQALIHERAEQDVAVLWVSAEAREVLRVCDRALVMCEGEITGVLHAGGGPEWCEDNLLAYATGMRRHNPAEAACW